MLHSNNYSYLMRNTKANQALTDVNFNVSLDSHISVTVHLEKLDFFYDACDTFKQYSSPESPLTVTEFYPFRFSCRYF